jgi:outer membrane receptor for ferrienterochelin and colicin
MNRLILAFLLVSAACTLTIAGTTGKIRGKVTDKGSGETVVGANVMVDGTQLGATTNVEGEYIIMNVPPGRYALRVSIVGYGPVKVRDVRVTVDQTTQVNAVLDASAVTMQDIIVEAERPMVQRDLTATLNTVSSDQIKMLPVRNFVEVVQLQAGIIADDRQIHIRGGRDYENAYMIDGMYVKNPVTGSLGTMINNDAIAELNVLSGTFNAEYGNASSGVINIVTKEGSSVYKATVEGRTSEFGVEPYKGMHENRVNASVSGPMGSDALTFFATGERDARSTWLPYGYDHLLSGLAKASARIVPELKLALSWRYSEEHRQPYDNSWKYASEQYATIKEYSRQGVATLTHTVRPNLFYDIRFSYVSETYLYGIEKDTSQFIPVGAWQYGPWGNTVEFWSLADPVEKTQNTNQIYDVRGDMTWQVGARNEVKAGLQFKGYDLHYFDVYDPKRNYPYVTDFTKHPIEAAGYVQDKIEVSSFVLNLGLRYDWMNQQAPYRQNPYDPNSEVSAVPKQQISPRLGIAHPISDRTSLHFSYGHFFQNHSYNVFYENSQYDFFVREPLFGSPDLDAERRVSFEVGLSHQFGPTIAGTFTAFYTDITGQVGTKYYEAFSGGRPVAYTVYVNDSYGNTKGFLINLTMRRTKNFSGSLNYTYQIDKKSASSELEEYPGPTESTLLYPTDWDRRHVINMSLNLLLPETDGPQIFGGYPLENTVWNLVLRGASGRPYTPAGRNVAVTYTERNSARMPGTYEIDFQASKDWRMGPILFTIFAEILNLTDAKNVVYVYADTGLPDQTLSTTHSQEYVQDPSNYGPPRRIRLGVRLQY